MDLSDQAIETKFPELRFKGYKLTSPATPEYNCIAWAAGVDDVWFEPDPYFQFGWPDNVPREYSLIAYKLLYQEFGFVECVDGELEDGFLKIAIYTDQSGLPTHASKQLKSGLWSSKLGPYKDIEHTLDGLSHGTYGEISVFMKKQFT